MLRALIPAGFMPASAQQQGIQDSFALEICHAGNAHISLADPASPTDKQADTCPFGLYNATSHGLPAHPPGVLPAISLFVSIVLPTYAPAQVADLDGPPVGSRAPPAAMHLLS